MRHIAMLFLSFLISLFILSGCENVSINHTGIETTALNIDSSDTTLLTVADTSIQTGSPQTEPPQTEPSQTEPPQTGSSLTEPPQTEPPQTDPPQTELPQTEPPQTEPPQTELPQTESPQTEPPQTEPPQTEPPQTEPPQTEPPQTEKVQSFNDTNIVMYATVALNVRDEPSANGQKLGYLDEKATVTVTGTSPSTKWVRIDFNGAIGYVNGKYLSDKKIVEETEPSVTDQKQELEPPVDELGFVTIGHLANRKSLQKKCTDEEFQTAYDAAYELMKPVANLKVTDQLLWICAVMNDIYESPDFVYSMEIPHYNDPYGYIINHCASCAGFTRAVGLCLSMIGIEYEHVNEGGFTHQWNRFIINGEYWVINVWGEELGPEDDPYYLPLEVYSYIGQYS